MCCLDLALGRSAFVPRGAGEGEVRNSSGSPQEGGTLRKAGRDLRLHCHDTTSMNLDAIHAAVNECIGQLNTGTIPTETHGESLANCVIQALEVCGSHHNA